MTKFIKLTECKGGVLIINTARIEHIILGAKGTDTYIKCKDNFFFVKESLDTIWKLLND